MARIHVLSPELANQIAAGEVVERPASVVKELVENALDAGARRIDVEVAGGGRLRVRVVDDGAGMSPEDARLALLRHATSKLTAVEDLFSLSTMGFRGEALPSVAAVSRLSIVTREAAALGGFRIDVEGGRTAAEGEAGCPVGTQVDVRDLLYNVPARLKFLKGDATELAHVVEHVARIALAWPAVHFTLAKLDAQRPADRLLLDLLPHPDARERALAVLGRRVRTLYRAAGEEGGVRVEAYLAAPDESVTTQRGLYLFVNRRFVRDRNLAHAVLLGYGELVPRGRYPVAVAHVELPAADVDVNVHPQKTEVRFRAPQDVQAALRHAVARLCAAAPWLRDPAAAGGAAPLKVYTLPPEVERPPAIREAVGRYFAARDAAPAAPALASPRGERERPEGQERLFRAVAAAPAEASPAPPPRPSGPDAFFAGLLYVGQLHGTYLVCQADGELVLIDQHAAHERVAFQRLRAAHETRAVRAQRLLFPQLIALDQGLLATAEEHAETLGALGFEVEPFGAGTLALKAIPEAAARAEPTRLLRDVLAELGARDSTEVLSERIDHVLATMACHGVIRAGDPVSPTEARALLEQMDGIDYKMHCPHGRPVLLRMRMDEIERRFGRT